MNLRSTATTLALAGFIGWVALPAALDAFDPPNDDVTLRWFAPTHCPNGQLLDPDVWEVRQVWAGRTSIAATLEDDHRKNPKEVRIDDVLSRVNPKACFQVRIYGTCGRLAGTEATWSVDGDVDMYHSQWYDLGCAQWSPATAPRAPALDVAAGSDLRPVVADLGATVSVD